MTLDSQEANFAKKNNKGYFDSGLEINKMLKISYLRLGVGVFYRYGHYKLPQAKDNIVFTWSVTTDF